MPDPTTPLGWAYALHEHLTQGAACRYWNQPSAEHDEQAKTCAARLGEFGEQRAGMLRVLEAALEETGPCVLSDALVEDIQGIIAGASGGEGGT